MNLVPGPVPNFAPSYGGRAAMMPTETLEVFVDVSPEVQPNFNRGPNNTFVMSLPQIKVMLSTSCQPTPPMEPGLVPFKPYEEFFVAMPELQNVVFDPVRRTPPNATATSVVQKRGAILEVPARVALNAQLKSNSPYGTLVLEDLHVVNGFKQKVGETTLAYQLNVQGTLSVNKGGGNCGSDRLEVDLTFSWTCTLCAGSSTAVNMPMPSMMGSMPPTISMGGPMPMSSMPMMPSQIGMPPMAFNVPPESNMYGNAHW